jgi:microcompartment protein CcmL/EutN
LPPLDSRALALFEVHSLTASALVVDAIEKSSGVEVVQAELNDAYGIFLRASGDVASLQIAVEEATRLAAKLRVDIGTAVLTSFESAATRGLLAQPEYQPLLNQAVVFPDSANTALTMSSTTPPSVEALGFIETQGFTAVSTALDAATKAASVEVVAREKLGGGYITIVIQGDIAAVEAAVQAGVAAIGDRGKLIASHVIARPSASVLKILSRV